MGIARELAELGSSYNAGGVSQFRNRIINGAMVIDQRNAGASVTPADGAYTLDRYQAWLSDASKISVQQSSVAPAGFSTSMLITSLSAFTITSNSEFGLTHKIEGLNISDLGWGTANAKTVTLSFWVRSSLTGTFGGVIGNNGLSRSYVFSYTISAANTWEQKSITIAGDTSGTWLTTNGTGVTISFNVGAGSSRLSTAGSWGTNANLRGVTGQTNLVSTNGATLYLTGAQLEVGPQATSFDFRDYGREMMLCQRYYCELGRQIFGRAESGTITTMVGGFPVRMRASPTQSVITSTNAIGVPGLTDSNVSSVLTNNSNDNGMSLGILTSGSTMLTGAPTVGSQNRIFGFSAEL
jgi:hypothetical protein